MSKMGEELEKRLDANKYKMWEILKNLYAERINIGASKPFWTPGNKELLESVIKSIEEVV